MNKIRLGVILRLKIIREVRLKRKKRHIMVMFSSMKAANAYYVQHMNTSAQNTRQLSGR